jgi:hypothetical protein
MTEKVVHPNLWSPRLEYRGMPEAADLTWEDNFFERENQQILLGSENVIAVFDFDYAEMEQYEAKRGCLALHGSLPPCPHT